MCSRTSNRLSRSKPRPAAVVGPRRPVPVGHRVAPARDAGSLDRRRTRQPPAARSGARSRAGPHCHTLRQRGGEMRSPVRLAARRTAPPGVAPRTRSAGSRSPRARENCRDRSRPGLDAPPPTPTRRLSRGIPSHIRRRPCRPEAPRARPCTSDTEAPILASGTSPSILLCGTPPRGNDLPSCNVHRARDHARKVTAIVANRAKERSRRHLGGRRCGVVTAPRRPSGSGVPVPGHHPPRRRRTRGGRKKARLPPFAGPSGHETRAAAPLRNASLPASPCVRRASNSDIQGS